MELGTSFIKRDGIKYPFLVCWAGKKYQIYIVSISVSHPVNFTVKKHTPMCFQMYIIYLMVFPFF